MQISSLAETIAPAAIGASGVVTVHGRLAGRTIVVAPAIVKASGRQVRKEGVHVHRVVAATDVAATAAKASASRKVPPRRRQRPCRKSR